MLARGAETAWADPAAHADHRRPERAVAVVAPDRAGNAALRTPQRIPSLLDIEVSVVSDDDDAASEPM